jgi:hypothetical protein
MKKLFILLLVLGCAGSGVHDQAPSPATAAGIITVRNEMFNDAVVYLSKGGVRDRRLGQVTGHSETTFVLHSGDFYIGEIGVAARFIGSSDQFADKVQTTPGARLVWVLGPTPRVAFLYEGR